MVWGYGIRVAGRKKVSNGRQACGSARGGLVALKVGSFKWGVIRGGHEAARDDGILEDWARLLGARCMQPAPLRDCSVGCGPAKPGWPMHPWHPTHSGPLGGPPCTRAEGGRSISVCQGITAPVNALRSRWAIPKAQNS